MNNKLEILAFTLYAIIARCKEIKSQLLSKKFQLLLIVDHFFTFLHSRPLKNYEDGRRINIESSFEGCSEILHKANCKNYNVLQLEKLVLDRITRFLGTVASVASE